MVAEAFDLPALKAAFQGGGKDVAAALSEGLARNVEAQQIPRERWPEALQKIGFTPDAARNFRDMTECMIGGATNPEVKGRLSAKTETTLQQYFAAMALDSPLPS